MASKRHVRRKNCSGKIKYTRQEAIGVEDLMRGQKRAEERVHCYECPFCKYWHLGHMTRSLRIAKYGR